MQSRSLQPALLLLLVAFAPPAHAYLDPATGSMILSAIVGLFATAALALKTWWYRLKVLFRRTAPAAAKPDELAAGQRGPDRAEPPGSD